MSGEETLTPEEIGELRKLLEIERIKKVRVLYTHLIDGREIDGLADLLTPDAIFDVAHFGIWHGRDEILVRFREIFKGRPPFTGLHFNTNMWIELTGPGTASSRSYLESVHNDAGPRTLPLAAYGLYEEDYRKLDGVWKISFSRLAFLWPQRVVAEEFPRRLVPGTLR